MTRLDPQRGDGSGPTEIQVDFVDKVEPVDCGGGCSGTGSAFHEASQCVFQEARGVRRYEISMTPSHPMRGSHSGLRSCRPGRGERFTITVR